MFKLLSIIALIIGAQFFYPDLNFVSAKEKPLNVRYEQLNKSARQEVDCLAQNMYFESGWEPKQGQIAVAMVTINRTESRKYPSTICGVVKQKTSATCQFTWVCEMKTIQNVNRDVYLRIRSLAVYVYANKDFIKDPTKGALFYHADYVNPGWKNMVYLTQIGRHKFYNRKDT